MWFFTGIHILLCNSKYPAHIEGNYVHSSSDRLGMGLRSGHFTRKLPIFFLPTSWEKLCFALSKYPDVLDLSVFIRVTFFVVSPAKTANHLLLV